MLFQSYALPNHQGAIHLWRPHGGVKLRWTHVEGDQVHADVNTENLEIYDLHVKILNFRVND